MRKITKEVTEAFLAMRPLTKGNTMTDGLGLYLHGNIIANNTTKGIRITLAGWNTVTTRERLNALPGVKVTTKLGQAYLNGKPWGGEWVTVADW